MSELESLPESAVLVVHDSVGNLVQFPKLIFFFEDMLETTTRLVRRYFIYCLLYQLFYMQFICCVVTVSYTHLDVYKRQILAWLNLKNIRFKESCVKTELLEIVKQNEHKFKKFVVNDIAEKSVHTV